MKREVARREIESLDYYLQNHTDDYGEESHTAMMMAISALSENKGEWIPVSEKNPGIGEHVLVCLKDGYIDTDDYYSYGFDDWKHLVVAWQPLPEPYKGVSE